MLFWIIIIAIALLCAGFLARALLTGHGGDEPPAAYDLRVYRDQLAEVDRDLARSVIASDDAERARLEISRRILAADAQLREGGETGGQPRGAGLVMAAAVVLGLAGGAALLYAKLGAPGLRDLPLETRIAASDAARAQRLGQAEAEAQVTLPDIQPDATEEFLALMDKLRETVALRPDDLQGLGLLVRNEAALGNFAAAHAAQAEIIRVKGPAAKALDYAVLGELMISAAAGYVSKDAEAALRQALQRDPTSPRARYYLGLYLLQVDRPDAAFRLWQALLAESPPDAPWVPSIRSRIEEVAWRAGVDYELPPLDAAPGPSAADIEAARDMTAEDRAAMIGGMVAGLADRLATEGGPPEDWARLIGAYGVLGETEQAAAIWAEAQAAFTDDAAALATIRAAAETAGVAE